MRQMDAARASLARARALRSQPAGVAPPAKCRLYFVHASRHAASRLMLIFHATTCQLLYVAAKAAFFRRRKATQ